MPELNQTHDSELLSWVDSANQADSDFPIQNLPYCVFQKSTGKPTIGVGIGDQLLDLRICSDVGFLDDRFIDPVNQPKLNMLMGLSVEDLM